VSLVIYKLERVIFQKKNYVIDKGKCIVFIIDKIEHFGTYSNMRIIESDYIF